MRSDNTMQVQVELPAIASRMDLANSMGLFLQKTNIIRDYLEDYVDGRAFWPAEVRTPHSRARNLMFVNYVESKRGVQHVYRKTLCICVGCNFMVWASCHICVHLNACSHLHRIDKEFPASLAQEETSCIPIMYRTFTVPLASRGTNAAGDKVPLAYLQLVFTVST